MRKSSLETPQGGYVHTDYLNTKKRIGAPTAEEFFYTKHLADKKEARRQRKKESRLEKARAAKARAVESLVHELETEEVEAGVESLFADGHMDIGAWLERYYQVVESGARSASFLSDEKLRDFVKGAAVSERIGRDIEHFLGNYDGIFHHDPVSQNAVSFDDISETLDMSKEEAIKLVALVSFESSASTLVELLEHRGDPLWDFLNEKVSQQEFSALRKLFKDADYVKELLTELLRQNAVILEKHLPAEKIDSLVVCYLKSNKHMAGAECRALFATEGTRERYLSLFAREKVSAMQYIDSYEFLFGELSKENFLQLFPEWHTAEWFVYGKYRRRYGLLLPGEEAAKTKGEEAIDLGGEADTSVEAEGIKGRVRVLEERRILELLSDRKEGAVAKNKVAYTDSDQEKDRALGIHASRGGKKENYQYIYTPYERSPAPHIEAMGKARERMERAPSLREKLLIFFADAWPQLLIARADEVADDEVVNAVKQAIGLMGNAGALPEHLSQLLDLSADPKSNKMEIERLAQALRNDGTLEKNRVYVHLEIIRRQRKTQSESKSVDLLSGLSYEIDETHNFVVDGKTTKIHELDRRIDRLNQDAPGLGFTYLGDNHGVVLKDVIRDQANANLIPHLNDATDYLVERGERIHPFNRHLQEALRRDFPANPTAEEIARIHATRYRSTRDHEQNHKEDEVRGVQENMFGTEKRAAQETTAYLASIAGRPEDKKPNAPFADIIKVMEIYIDRRTSPYGALQDFGRVYERASERILHLFADKLLPGNFNREIFREDPVQACDLILQKVLEHDRESLRHLAGEILSEETARQNKAYHLTEIGTHSKGKDVAGGSAPQDFLPTADWRDDESIFPTAPTAPEYELKIDPKIVRKYMRAAAFSAILVAAVSVFNKDGSVTNPNKTAPDDAPAAKTGRGMEDASLMEREPAKIITGGMDEKPSRALPKVDVDVPPPSVGDSKESRDHQTQASVLNAKERAAFKRGLWGYAEQVLRDRGLRKPGDKKYNHKIAQLVDIFLRALESEGMVTRGNADPEWHVPFYGDGLDRIVALLRTEVSGDVIDSLVKD